MRKTIYKYRLNGENCTEEDVINYAYEFGIPEEDYDQYIEIEIEEAIEIIRAHRETVEYLGS